MQPLVYTPQARWDGSNAAPAPIVANNKGYDVTAPRFPESRRETAYSRANGTLNNNTFQWPMFVTDVSIDVALSGSTAQARLTRDFYPHNFVQPSFVIQGQALDQADYGMLCEFIHYSQQNSIANDGALLQLWIKGGGIGGKRVSKGGVHVNNKLLNQQKFQGNQMIRGGHNQILCQGYVTTMPRQHTAGVVSPTYTMSFAVAYMISGIYSENMVQVQKQANWIDLLQGTSNLSTNKTLVKENQKILHWVQNNSANIFNTGS